MNAWLLLTGSEATGTTTTHPQPIIAAWVLGHRRLEPAFLSPLAPGCRLMVEPLSVLWAKPRVGTDEPPGAAEERAVAWSEGGTAFLLLRPTPAMLGHSIFVQLGIYAPGENMLGVLVSHAVQIEVGNVDRRLPLP